jgi:hypothetical protein
MPQESILGTSKLVAFAPVTDLVKARVFYENVLGLRLVEDEKPFALVFDANGTMLRVTPVAEHNILRRSQCWAGKWNPSNAPSINSPRPVSSSNAIPASTTPARMAFGPHPAEPESPGFTIPTKTC